MKRSKVFLAITTSFLAIAGVAATRAHFTTHTGCIITSGLTKVNVNVACTSTGVAPASCSYITAGPHKTSLPVFTTKNCTFRLYTGS